MPAFSNPILLSTLLCTLWLTGCTPPKDQVTIYGETCLADADQCRKYGGPVYIKTTYRVSFDQQRVVANRDTLWVDALNDCRVFDKKNWACREVWMDNGKLLDPQDSKMYWKQMNRFYWHLKK
ncbi:MAG: hypothetical protein M0Q95_17160 [Porticoccaceae bacterium]|nr:hypothetical protein [Porticoccaceae bacterium]